MQPYILDEKYLTPETRAFYQQVLITLLDSKIPFLPGVRMLSDATRGLYAIPRTSMSSSTLAMP
mgnify:CR=1 FL=1